MADEAEPPTRWFRRSRYGLQGLELGPWHLIVSTDKHSYLAYAACGVDSYMAHNRPGYATAPVGELPEGKVCARCRRKALSH